MSKAALKRAREAIAAKQWARALTLVDDIVTAGADADSAEDASATRYMALVFRALCLQNIPGAAGGKPDLDKAIDSYEQAIAMDARNPLAFQGLEKLYASSKNYEGLARVWPQLIDLYAEQVRLSSNDETAVPLATKAVDLQLKLIATLRDELHRVREACDALKQFLPGSKFEDIVPHAEKAMQVKVPTPLAIWREIARLQDADERASVQREVQARRYRLGAPPLATIRADMEREVLTESTLHISLREVLAATDDEQERHAVSLKLVDLLEKRLRLLQVAAEVKLGIRRELLGLCRELVIDRQVDDLTCMLILIENEDVDTMSDYDQTIIGRVHNAHPKHELAKVHMVWQAYGDGSDATDAIEKIQTIVKDAGSSQLTFTSLVLMSLQLAANDFNGALETARQLKAKLERATMELCFDCPRLMRRADVTIARCYAESNKTEVGLAEEVYKKLLALNREDRECLRGLARVYERLDRHQDGMVLLERIREQTPADPLLLSDLGWFHFNCGQLESAKAFFESSLAHDNTNAATHLKYARTLWDLGGIFRTDKSHALAHLLHAAKLGPELDESFFYLGRYYREVDGDVVRSLKCLQKAFALNPANIDVAKLLSKAYEERGDQQSALRVYEISTEKNVRSHWAWMRLGLAQMHADRYYDAIISLQTALRSDIKDVICWEALAESYEREGRFTSALKAYRKVCALDERSLLATFRIGSILLILGHYVEAVEHLHCALVLCEDDDQRVPVWNALASANLELSGDQIEKGVYGSAADCLALAVKHGRKCIYYDTALDSPWVVVGRALITFAEIPNYLSLCPWNTVQDLVKSNKAGSLTHDFPSLSKALDDRQSLAGVAHAASICLASALTANSSADQWREFALALHTSDDFDGAVKAAKHALLLDSKSARCWMTLGDLMARRDAGIAQHAYIKAIECDTLSAEPWNNLAVLYLANDELDLAGQAFFQAQTLNPEMATAWIGQAIIAEFSGEDTILNSFQHSVNVSRYTLAEASYGLALATMRSSWTATLDEAAFALHKLVEKFPSDWVVINLLGIFRERSGQLQLAADAYRKAANCSPEGKRALVLVNLARCITALGDSITAQRIYDNIPADQFDALTLLCKGIALYHCGSLQESFQLIERVLKTDNVRTRSEACLYLSQVLFELGEAEKATQYLLECFTSDKQFTPAIFCLCASGIISGNWTLASAALQELTQIAIDYLDEVDKDGDTEWLSALVFLSQGNTKVAKGFLCKAIHKHPGQALRWERLMRFLLRQQSHAAEELGRVASSSVTVGSTCYADIAGALLAAGDTSNALRWAWRAVRESPLSARAWMTAVTSLRGTVANAMEKGATSEHIAKLLDRWETTLSLAPSWRRDRDGALFNDCPELVSILQLLDLERRYIVATMATDDAQSARLTAILHYVDQFIAADNAQSSSSSLLLPSAYQLLAACLSRLAYHAQAVSALQNAITLSPERFDLWVALAIAYRRSRNTVAAVECLQCATTLPGISRDRCTKVALFIAQAVFALASSRNVALASSRDCLAIASDAVNAALQLDPTSRNARMLQAIVNLRQGNKSKAVKLLRADTGADHDGDEDVIYGHKEWLARAEAA